jgi:hypothetical protein
MKEMGKREKDHGVQYDHRRTGLLKCGDTIVARVGDRAAIVAGGVVGNFVGSWDAWVLRATLRGCE